MTKKEKFIKQKSDDTKLYICIAVALITIILFMLNSFSFKSMSFALSAEGETADRSLTAYSPHLSFPKGEYTFNLSGSAYAVITTADGNVLGEGEGNVTVTLEKDESDIIVCSEKDSSLSNVTVSKNGVLYTDLIFVGLFLAAAMAGIIYLRFSKRSSRECCIIAGIIAAAVIIASYPLFGGTILFGHDLNFHLYRMEGIKDGLLSGQFPVRVHPTHNNGYGYITASVYPELFLYFPAILRVLGVSSVTAYSTFLVGVNALTAFIMYYSTKGISKSKYAGLLASVIYTLSTWRVINLYYRAALGEALAMAFFPLVIYGLYCILQGDRKKWWVFALACTGVFQSHIISTLFVALTTVIMLIIFAKDFVKDKRYKELIKAAVLTVLLNAWFLAPFLTYYLGLDMSIKHVAENTEFWQNAIFPPQLFNVFNTSFGFSKLVDEGMKNDMSLSLGLGVSVCAVICLAYFTTRKKRLLENSEKFNFIFFAFGVLLVFMATTLFPWQLLQKSHLINKFCGTVRMPWRFLSLASPVFTVTAAIITAAAAKKDNARKIILAVACFVCAVSFVSWGNAYITQNDPAVKKGTAVSTYKASGYDDEYFIMGTKTASLNPGEYKTSSPSVEVISYEKKGTNIELEISGAEEGSYVEVPLLYYPGYSVRDNNSDKLETMAGRNKVMRIILNEGTSSVKIKYSGFWYFKLADLLTLLTLIGWGVIIYGRKKGKEWKFI